MVEGFIHKFITARIRILSLKEIMFAVLSVCLSVCLSRGGELCDVGGGKRVAMLAECFDLFT